MQLYNKISAEERARIIDKSSQERITLSFYKYVIIRNARELRNELFVNWNKLNVLGRVYLAEEGINAQISIPKYLFSSFKRHLKSITYFKNIPLNN